MKEKNLKKKIQVCIRATHEVEREIMRKKEIVGKNIWKKI